ncbi:hypothetical protein [Salicola sp. Rm-C-2C1-2]|uniref:hypothetical protein n=1 Tax=Salicola sp. Rm-C-2C1-2 TaxID=3141321 RepID=UPI0032E3EF77
MTLHNLLGSSLEAIEPDAAYKAIMQLANLALQAEGYRTLTSRPGHHRTMIQLLTKTVGLDSETMILLDTLRKQRNVSDYSGDPVPRSAVDECFRRATDLEVTVQDWLAHQHADLLP